MSYGLKVIAMIDFGNSGILNGLSQAEVFALVVQALDEVGIEYEFSPGGIGFLGLNPEEDFRDCQDCHPSETLVQPNRYTGT